jgi:hypothetical protein
MQADRVVLAPALQHCERRTTGTKKILGVNLQEIKGRLALDQIAVMGVSPANAYRASSAWG